MSAADPFAALGLEPRFALDEKALEHAYFTLQRQYHPDRFARSEPAERLKAQLRSMEINEAYSQLKQPLMRAMALLKRQNILVNTESDTIKPPPALLVEIMEQREALEEAMTAEDIERLQAEAQHNKDECLQALGKAFEQHAWALAGELTLKLGYLEKLILETRSRKRKAG